MHAAAARQLRPLFQVALPVVVAVVLVCLAVLNMALVKTWPGEAEDGVLWTSRGTDVIASDIAPGSSADRAGIRRNDVLLTLNEDPVQG
jgi:membrane-associated protease RseP (regulator of RpoE activity)